jgi:hypothetical protein
LFYLEVQRFTYKRKGGRCNYKMIILIMAICLPYSKNDILGILYFAARFLSLRLKFSSIGHIELLVSIIAKLGLICAD